MKPVTKNFNTFKVGRINARQEVKKQQRIRNNLERSVAPKLNTGFRQFVKETSNQIKQLNEPNFDELKKSLNIKLELVMRNHYTKVFRTIFNNNEEKYYLGKKDNEAFVFGRSFDFERLVEIYMSSRVPYFSGMTEQASKEIQKVIFDGRADNLTLDQISRSITKKGYPIARRRANLIARTETHNAASFANNEYHKKVQQDLGTDMKKKWVSTSDLRTRSAHSAANGQEVNMDEDFIVGGVSMSYAGDPKGGAKNVINCRCIIIYAESSDVIQDDLSRETVDEKPANLTSNDDIDISPENQQRVLGRFVPFGTPPEEIREQIRQALAASKIDIDDIFGATIPKELEWHKTINHWRGETDIINTLKKVSPLKKIINKGSRANYSLGMDGKTPTLNMARIKSPKNKEGVITFRHEYGHHMDFDQNNVDKWIASGRGSKFNRQGKDTRDKLFSREASNDVIEDSVKLLKRKAEAEQNIVKYYSKDLSDFDLRLQLASGNYTDKVWSDNFLKRLGFKVEEKLFRDNVVRGITERRRVGLMEKIIRTGSIDDVENAIKSIVNNSKTSIFNYDDLQKILGKDFIKSFDELGSSGYKSLIDLVAKIESGLDYDLFNYLASYSKRFNKGNSLGLEFLYFDDYIGSISRSKYTSGHGATYYQDFARSGFASQDYRIPVNINNLSKDAKILLENEFGGTVTQKMTTEAFANYIALLGGENAKYWRQRMMRFAPDTTKKFDEIIEFINGIDT